jgi:hypothetical protein
MHAVLHVLIAIDVSGSTLSTDPGNVRWWAVRRVARWMARHHSADKITIATFDEAVHMGRERSPRSVARSPRDGLPITHGGTRFVPVVEAAFAYFGEYPEGGYGLVIVTDGMSDDAAQAAAMLRELDLHASVVPFGDQWPFVKAAWEDIDVLQLYEHPGVRLRQMARSIALGVMTHTGEVERPPRRLLRRPGSVS